ncbi:SusC/RagA family TonB-linked outer membrane protein [Chitinophaga sp.]|uniref:SusC/RagA family TonB-linked outer membrane protein n=1 Tax=Chitinophaga sp. TaxID=1869181 RepID=UPI0031D0624B
MRYRTLLYMLAFSGKVLAQSVPDSIPTASMSKVTGEELYKTPAANITNTFYGRLPGIITQQASGEPGYDNASFVIRGIGTYDNNDIAIFVDGFQVNNTYFQYLSAVEIADVKLYKDAAALATFGMRGANGVLWITTKRGHAGKPTVQVQVRNGVQQAENINKPLRSYDYARLYNQAVSNDLYAVNNHQYIYTPKYTSTQLDAYKNGTGTDIDWFDEVLKKNAIYRDANITFSGGDTSTRYALIVDYMKNQGLYNVATNATTSNAQIQRFNLRANLDFSFFKIFEAKVDLGGRIEDRRYPNFNGPSLWNNMAMYPSNIYPVKDESGNWSGTTIYPNNPVASLKALGWASTHDRTLQANFNLKQKLDFITPGLYLNEAVSFNTWTRNAASKTATYARYYNGIKTTTDITTDIVASNSAPSNQYDWKQANLSAGYDRTFGLHAVHALVNYFASNYIEDWNGTFNGSGYNTGNNIFHHYTNLGGTIDYTYREKYMLGLGFGYSGSDNYAPGHNHGFYPAISAGWIALTDPLYLKIRASAGKSGNENSQQGRYLFQQYYGTSTAFYTGVTSLNSNTAVSPTYIANPNIFAEHSMKYNVGFDMTLFKKLDIVADAYMDKRGGIITYDQASYAATIGTPLMFKNIGKMTNRGIEFTANYHDSWKGLGYRVGGSVLYHKNTIDYKAEIPPVNGFNKTTGLSYGTPMGLISEGLYQIDDFNADGSLKAGQPVPVFGAVQPGDIKYKDLDNSGFVDQNDVTKIGRPSYPSVYYSFNASLDYKGFDLSVLFQGSAGADFNLLNASVQTMAFVNNGNAFPMAKGAWAYYPSEGIDTRNSATYPRLTTLANTNNYRNSTFWIKKNNYLRIRNIEVGYSLPEAFLKRAHLTRLRLFMSATNPVTISKLLRDYNFDPETPTGYPGLKSYIGGLSVSFN